MTIPFYCVVFIMVWVLVTKGPVSVAMARMEGGYDNRHPRAQQAKLTGWAARGVASHQNGFEAFPLFAAGVLIAHVGNGDPGWAATLAVTHVVSRVVYSALYLMDIHWLRSIVFTLGWLCSVLLALLPAWQ